MNVASYRGSRISGKDMETCPDGKIRAGFPVLWNWDTVIETRHLSRSVGGKLLVDDVSVEVAKGKVLAVVGPSGAGKSSFLRLLNRLDEPTGGAVLLESQDYRDIPP